MTWAYFFKMARKRRRAKRSEEKEKGQTQAKNEIGGFEQCFWLFFFIFFFATIYLVGHTREMNVPIALYFLTVTMTGVGYGEFYPGSQESRVVIMFFALLGNMVIFMIMSEVSDTVLDVRLEVLRRIKRAVVFAGGPLLARRPDAGRASSSTPPRNKPPRTLLTLTTTRSTRGGSTATNGTKTFP